MLLQHVQLAVVLEDGGRRVTNARASMQHGVGLLRLHPRRVRVVRGEEVRVDAVVGMVRVLERHLLQLTSPTFPVGVDGSVFGPQELD